MTKEERERECESGARVGLSMTCGCATREDSAHLPRSIHVRDQDLYVPSRSSICRELVAEAHVHWQYACSSQRSSKSQLQEEGQVPMPPRRARGPGRAGASSKPPQPSLGFPNRRERERERERPPCVMISH